MANALVDDCCKTIRRGGLNVTIEQVEKCFDVFVSELKKIDIPDEKYFLIERIASHLTNLSHKYKKLAEPELIKHEFFVILRDTVIIEYLHRKRIEENVKCELLLNVCRIFTNICCNINNNNIIDIKHLLFCKPLIDEIGNCLNDIGKDGKYLNEYFFLRSIGFLLLSFKHFRFGRHEILTDEYLLISPILSGVIQCLCSSYALQIIQNLELNFIQKLNDCQMLFLDTMSLYLQWYSSDYRDTQNFIQILRSLLHEFTRWLTSCQPESFLQCSSKVATMIRHLSVFLIRPIESDNLNLLSEEFSSDYCQLALYYSLILKYSTDKINSRYPTRIILQSLYNLTLHLNVLYFMKTIPNLISMLLRMTDAEEDEIQLNTYRCLGKLLIETDIKTMANPDKIASVYIEFIRKTIDDPKNQERFFSLLESLKNFVQHDQVKIELIKQQALSLLIRCVLEIRFNPIKVQMIALEILLALSFNSDGYFLLRQNQNLLNHIRSLANNINSIQSGLQRAAEGLLWKLETEEEAIAKSTTSNIYKYDIMISYSHKNQKICLQIHEQLIKDGFRVWFDRDCLRGSTMVGMANAIENSQYVLICMSNTYKQSVYCQSEAHYAFERGCLLIPIIIEPNYKPDGWLGIIVSGKIYINFTNIQFNDAYERLKTEIYEQQNRNFNQLTMKDNQKDQIETILITPQHIEFIDLPDCIIQWTNDHVKSFLFRLKLNNTILLLCTNMNGLHLLQLYEICITNRESMYQSLKFELNERHQILLPIADYITFIQEIKPYIQTNVNTSQSSLSLCNII